MSAALEHVLRAALALPESDRVELIDALIGTLPPDDAAPIDDAWLAEIDRRSREYDEGKVTPVAWGEMKKRARLRMNERGRLPGSIPLVLQAQPNGCARL